MPRSASRTGQRYAGSHLGFNAGGRWQALHRTEDGNFFVFSAGKEKKMLSQTDSAPVYAAGGGQRCSICSNADAIIRNCEGEMTKECRVSKGPKRQCRHQLVFNREVTTNEASFSEMESADGSD
jgi:hypothetical protein